jgi:hypothetical protein
MCWWWMRLAVAAVCSENNPRRLKNGVFRRYRLAVCDKKTFWPICCRPLKEGGILVYSTCSYSVEENEAVVEDLMNSGEMQLVQFEIPAAWGLVDSGKGFRFYPHLTKSEGFFLCCVAKNR